MSRIRPLLIKFAATAVLFIFVSSFGSLCRATSLSVCGLRATEGGGGEITAEWTTGNLGNTWGEGEWIPYQIIISSVQTDYPGLTGFPDIVLEYDFTSYYNNARFIDLVRSVQAGTTKLSDVQGWPSDNGSAYPMVTRADIEDAQNDVGNLNPLDNLWTNFTSLNLPNSQVNRSAPPSYSDGTTTDSYRYLYVTKQDLIDAGISTSVDSIVIYLQLHESRSFIWSNSFQGQYDSYPTDEWGGYIYSQTGFATDFRNGSGYVPGSSGHFRVYLGEGSFTVPLPIPESLPGAISGTKWLDLDGDGIYDGDEGGLSGWRIYLSGTFDGVVIESNTLTDGLGNYSFDALSSNVLYTVSESSSREIPVESGFSQSYPSPGMVVGQGTGVSIPPDPDFGSTRWEVYLAAGLPSQEDMNFGNWLAETQSPKIIVDSLVISQTLGPDTTVMPSQVLIIAYDDIVTVFGSTYDEDGSPVGNQIVEIFDGVSYNYELLPNGLSTTTTNAQGIFSYTLARPPEELSIAQLFPYWFATDYAAIPLILPFDGEETLLATMDDALADMLAGMEHIPDGAVLSLGSVDNPGTVAFSSYPENPEELESQANDMFFEGYACIYSGPIDRAFLSPSTNSWLDRGQRLSDERINSVADQLHSLSTTTGNPAWEPICFKADGKWQSVNSESFDKKNADFNFKDVNWASIGIGAVTCGVGLVASGGALALAVCAPLAITVSNEILIKPAVPDFCDLVIQAEDPELCRDLGGLSADGFAMFASLPYSFLPNNNVTMFNNYYNMSKDPLKQAYWASQYFNYIAGYVDLGQTYIDMTHFYGDYWPEVSSGYKEAAGLLDFNLVTPDVGAIQNTPLQLIVTDRQGAEHQIISSFDDPEHPTALSIEAQSSRAAYGPVMPNILQAPILRIRSSLMIEEFEWTSVDLEQGIYSVEIPLTQLPNYVVDETYNASIIVGSEDIFSNERSNSEGSSFGVCTVEGITLVDPDGNGIVIPPGSVPYNIMIQQNTDYAGSTPGFWPKNYGVIDSTFIISNAMTVYMPDTINLSSDCQIFMKLDSLSVYPFFNSGTPIMIGRWNPEIEDWDILTSEVDTTNLIISAPSSKLGGFVVLSIVEIVNYLCGDADGDRTINIGDAVFLINYIFKGGPAPEPLDSGDANCDSTVNIGDAVYLINYIFKGGPEPCCP